MKGIHVHYTHIVTLMTTLLKESEEGGISSVLLINGNKTHKKAPFVMRFFVWQVTLNEEAEINGLSQICVLFCRLFCI